MSKLRRVVIFVVIFCLILQLDIYGAGNNVSVVSSLELPNMKVVTENKCLSLYINQKTAEIAVMDKMTGAVYFSNPPERDKDNLANAGNKEKMGAQISITYFTGSGQIKTMNSAVDSVKPGQFEIVPVEKGVKVVFVLGKEAMGKENIPSLINKERFEELILSKVEDEDEKKLLEKCYKLISLNDAENEEKKNELLEKYPTLENGDLYELSTYTKTFEYPVLYTVIKKAGYTVEDLNKDNFDNNINIVIPENEMFKIPIVYTLDNNNLVARISCSEIECPEKLPLTSIRVLEHFNSIRMGEEGYIFVPDGSGALINYNDPDKAGMIYGGYVYGKDYAMVEPTLTSAQTSEQVNLPVFGIKRKDNATFAVIEEGDAHGLINANIGGITSSYNNVYSEFNILPWTSTFIYGTNKGQMINVYQKTPYQGDIKIRYVFLNGEDANYVGMAKYYRQYLMDKGTLKKIKEKKELPFVMEVIGGVYIKKSILGIPWNAYEPLTKFDEAARMVMELQDKGVDNIKIKYSGWFNGGLYPTPPLNIKIDKKLGGLNGFKSLMELAQENNFSVYPEASFLHIYKTPIGYSTKSNLACFIDGRNARKYQLNMSGANYGDWNKIASHLLSPFKLAMHVDKFMKNYLNMPVGGVALRDIGKELNSDFKEERLVDRQDAEKIVEEQTKKFYDSGLSIMVSNGHAYTLPYVDSIINMPLANSNYIVESESIPFYQIVVHGCVNYAGEPVNLAVNYKQNILKSFETGAGLYYKWIYADPSVLKNSYNYSELYSLGYKDWFEQAINLYEDLNSTIGDVTDQLIIDHRKLSDGVYQTTYEEGKSIIVNYNKKAVTIDGFEIEPENFRVVGKVGVK